MNTINAKSYLSNLPTAAGATVKFYLKPENTTNVTFDELCQKAATASGLPYSTVKYAFESMNQKVVDLLAKNSRVHTGLFVASLGIGGSLSSFNEQPNKVDNPVHAVFTPEGSIVDTLKAIEVVNTSVTVEALLNEILEAGLAEMNKLTTANTNIVINGEGLDVDTTAEDEGVWLTNRDTGVIVKTATVVEHSSARLVVKFATLPEDGRYNLVVATRNGNASMDVTTVSRIVTVEAAE